VPAEVHVALHSGGFWGISFADSESTASTEMGGIWRERFRGCPTTSPTPQLGSELLCRGSIHPSPSLFSTLSPRSTLSLLSLG